MRGVGLALLAWLLSRAEWGQMGVRLGDVDTLILLISPLLTVALFALRAGRWRLLVRADRMCTLSLGRAWAIYATGFFLGVITPGRLGDLAKALYAERETGASLRRALAGTLADRLCDIGLLAPLALWGLWQLGLGGWAQTQWPALVAFGPVIGAVAVVVVAGLWLLRRAVGRYLPAHRWGAFARDIGAEISRLAGRTGWIALGLSGMAYAVYFAHTYLLARALDLPLTYADMVAITALIGLAAFLPISVAGLGTREGVLVVAMAAKGLADSIEAALAYAALFFLACYVLPALLGLCCWWYRPLSLADLRAQAAVEGTRTRADEK